MLFGVKPWDGITFLAVLAGLALVAFAACLVPGMHAARVPPVEALKAD
jgi:ABC-type lipoprotein release transport system permease subunit